MFTYIIKSFVLNWEILENWENYNRRPNTVAGRKAVKIIYKNTYKLEHVYIYYTTIVNVSRSFSNKNKIKDARQWRTGTRKLN